MNEDKPNKSAASRVSEQKRFALTRLVELIGGAELARRTGLPRTLFYYLIAGPKRGKPAHERIAREHAAVIYDAAGEHIREVQLARRQLRTRAFRQRRRRKDESE